MVSSLLLEGLNELMAHDTESCLLSLSVPDPRTSQGALGGL